MNKWFAIIVVLLLFSCNEENIEWDLKEGKTPPLVVEGLLTNQRTSHLVKLSKPTENMNEEPEMISGAAVMITDGSDFNILQESNSEAGFYYTEPNVQGVAGKVYYLRIELNGEEYWAADSMVPVSTEKPVHVIESDSIGFYKLQMEEIGNPSMIEIDLNWENTSTCIDGNCIAKQTFFVLHNIDVNKIFQSENMEEILFPSGTVLIQNKYSLSPTHEKFARSMLMETDWRGGFFDVLPGQVYTNLTSGAVGFFAACSVISDTLVVK